MVNDHPQAVRGTLVLSLEDESGQSPANTERRFELAAGGDASYELPLTIPRTNGKCMLKAIASPDNGGKSDATICRRWVKVE